MTDTTLHSRTDDQASVVDRIIDGTITAFRERAFHEVTIDQVAERAGVDVAEVERHFPTWDGLLLATVDRWNGLRMQPLLPLIESRGTVLFLRGIVADNVADPALMRMLVGLLNVAATPSHPLSPHLQARYQQFAVLVRASLTRDVELGRAPVTMDPAHGTEQLIALYEGLQLQSMVRPGLDLLAAYDRAVTRLTHGWAVRYVPPVWEF